MNLYLVRHAHAGDRKKWIGRDSDRPLSARGRDEAEGIIEALAVEPIARVLTSPALRCQQTVAGLAVRCGVELEVTEILAEGAATDDALDLVTMLAKDGDDVVLCGHGDLLPELVHALARNGTVLEGGTGFAKGALWHVVGENGSLTRARYIRHPTPKKH